MADRNYTLLVAAYGDDASAAAEDFKTVKGLGDTAVVAAVVLSRDDSTRPSDTADLRALLASAVPGDLDRARTLLRLISARQPWSSRWLAANGLSMRCSRS